jgi:hypothetical protein
MAAVAKAEFLFRFLLFDHSQGRGYVLGKRASAELHPNPESSKHALRDEPKYRPARKHTADAGYLLLVCPQRLLACMQYYTCLQS